MNKAWLYVFLTCAFELIWLYGFNYAHTWWQWGIVIGIILIDFSFLPKACATLPTGTVYAIFAGAGTMGAALMDIYLFGGSFSIGKAVFMTLIIIGVIGLKLTDSTDGEDTMKGAA